MMPPQVEQISNLPAKIKILSTNKGERIRGATFIHHLAMISNAITVRAG
jgi:hypothetical protein